jgi:hypothetical protein
LSQTGLLAVFADAFAQQLAIFFCDHDWLISQSGSAPRAQILLAIILRLRSIGKYLRNDSE